MNAKPQTLALLTLALLAAAVPTLSADGPARSHGARSTERTLESSTAAISLPSVVPGPMFVQDCATCPRQELRVTSRTSFRVGSTTVSLAELAAFARAGGPYFTMIHYGLTSPEVRLVQVSGQFVSGAGRR